MPVKIQRLYQKSPSSPVYLAIILELVYLKLPMDPALSTTLYILTSNVPMDYEVVAVLGQ